MSKIIMVTGGARSGKSTYAENIIHNFQKVGDVVVYLATATACDEEMAERINIHQERRPKGWTTVEKFQDFKDLNPIIDETGAKFIMLDCLGFMLNNIMFHSDIDFNKGTYEEYGKIEEKMVFELKTISSIVRNKDIVLVVVTNEVGMGLVPADKMSRYYRDILGRSNREMAILADEVYGIFSGIPLKLK